MNVDIKFSMHDASLEKSSSGKFNVKIFESRIIQKLLWSMKGHKQYGQNQLKSPMPEGNHLRVNTTYMT
jgi:hypothetical protein